MSVYEWRSERWRDVTTYDVDLRQLQDRCVGRIYVDVTGVVDLSDADRRAWVDDSLALMAAAAELDIEIGMLAGDPWWTTPEGLIDTSVVLDFVAEVDRIAAANDRPGVVGLHLDIEPWGLAQEWENDPQTLAMDWLAMIDATQAYASRNGMNQPVSWLVPAWFDGDAPELPPLLYNGETRSVFDHGWSVLDAPNNLVVMAYRNTADGDNGILALSRTEVATSEGRVTVALETVAVEPAILTFAESTWDGFMAETLDVVERTKTKEIVVNDVEGLLGLEVVPVRR